VGAAATVCQLVRAGLRAALPLLAVLRVSCGSGAKRALGVVSAQTEKVVEFFLTRDDAVAMIREVREDEPELADELRIEEISLDASAKLAGASLLTEVRWRIVVA